MARDWQRLRALSWRERRELLCAAVALPAVRTSVRLLGLRRSRAILSRLSTPGGMVSPETTLLSTSDLSHAVRTARLVRIASTRGLIAANCLERSLVLWWLLRRRGLCGEIRYGANKEAGSMAAHAWVTVGGQVVGDRSDIGERFIPFEAVRNERRI